MDPEYITKLAWWSAWVALALSLALFAADAPLWAWGVAAGAAWAIANFFFLRFLVVRWIRPDDEKRTRPKGLELALGLLVKFPLLYGAGYWFLQADWCRVEALCAGFILPFVVVFVDALGRAARDARSER